jgi:enoyl-CoA hydratase/carnithine racemase
MAVDYRKEGKIAFFTLNRPEALNAIDIKSLEELSQALIDFKGDESLLVGIVTGTGERAFSVGADIRSILPQFKENKGKPGSGQHTFFRGLDLWKPMIAAVNGYALGGGLEIALACDIRIAAENAMFGMPEVTLGIIPGWGGTQRLPRIIPQAKAAEMLFTGKPIDAKEAYRIGLVNKVVPPAQLMAAAQEMADSICRPAPLAVRAAKQAMLLGADRSLEDGIELEKTLMDYLVTTADFEEGSQAFLSKRKPEFKGK